MACFTCALGCIERVSDAERNKPSKIERRPLLELDECDDNVGDCCDPADDEAGCAAPQPPRADDDVEREGYVTTYVSPGLAFEQFGGGGGGDDAREMAVEQGTGGCCHDFWFAKDQRAFAVASDGTIYVADARNHRIRVILPRTRAVRTLAGSGACARADGLGERARCVAGSAYAARPFEGSRCEADAMSPHSAHAHAIYPSSRRRRLRR